MALQTRQTARNANNTHTVTRGTTVTALPGSARALVALSAALTQEQALQAFRALRRHIHRDQTTKIAPSAWPTSGATEE